MDKRRTLQSQQIPLLAKMRSIWIALCALVTLNSCNGQNNHALTEKSSKQSQKYSLTCCINTEIEKVRTNIHPQRLMESPYKISDYSLRVDHEKIFLQDKILTDSAVIEWSEETDADSIHVYVLQSNHRSFFILSSRVKQATGLASNITTWLVIDVEKKLAYSLSSLSNNVDLFYFQDSDLRVITFDYSDEFIENKDYDNMSFTVTHYLLIEGEERIAERTISKCPCDSVNK